MFFKWTWNFRKTGYRVEKENTIPEGLEESRRLEHCYPSLREIVRLMQRDAKEIHGKALIITSVYRSPKKQNELYQIGRRGVPREAPVTQLDGFERKSRHNEFPSTAVDFAVDEDPGIGIKITWKPEEYKIIGVLAKKYGAEWGGDWKTFPDYPHVQLPRELA